MVGPLKIKLGISCDKDTLTNWAMFLPNFTPKHWPKYIHVWLAKAQALLQVILCYLFKSVMSRFFSWTTLLWCIRWKSRSFFKRTNVCLALLKIIQDISILFFCMGHKVWWKILIHSEYFAWRAPCSLGQRWVKLLRIHTWNDISK